MVIYPITSSKIPINHGSYLGCTSPWRRAGLVLHERGQWLRRQAPVAQGATSGLEEVGRAVEGGDR
jgi:hypothetical protein